MKKKAEKKVWARRLKSPLRNTVAMPPCQSSILSSSSLCVLRASVFQICRLSMPPAPYGGCAQRLCTGIPHIDQPHGGWCASVAEDGAADKVEAKSWAQGWNGAYHNGRALMNYIKQLEQKKH